jgi:protein-tyrosine-phosphatase
MKNQFAPKNVLLVCVGNITRSKVAEEYMQKEITSRGYQENSKVESAGVAVGTQGRQITKDLADKADLLIAMDEIVAYSLSNSFGQVKTRITPLAIRDDYEQDIEGLVRELDKQLLPIINLYFPYK